MKHVDALSRVALTWMIQDSTVNRIRRAQEKDPKIKAIFTILQNGMVYVIGNGIDKLVIPQRHRREMIRQTHETGHISVKKTLELLSRDY